MATVGFEEVEIGIYDPVTEQITESFVWKDENGGTVNMTITGLEPTITRAVASNKTVWQSKRGTGQVTSTFEAFNPPEEQLDKVLGREKDENGSSWVGNNTQAPYVALIAKASNIDGEPVYLALPKGMIGYNEIPLATTNPEEETAPPNTVLTGTWQDAEIAGDSRVFGKHIGSEGYDAFRTLVFPGAPSVPTA